MGRSVSPNPLTSGSGGGSTGPQRSILGRSPAGQTGSTGSRGASTNTGYVPSGQTYTKPGPPF